MSQTKEEILSIFATWIGPPNLADTEANGNRIVQYVFQNGAMFSHANLTAAATALTAAGELEYIEPTRKVRTVDPPNAPLIHSHRNHKDVAQQEQSERTESLSTLETIKQAMADIQQDHATAAAVPTIYYPSGKINHGATAAARAKLVKK
jgi:hypothetical protein